MESRINVTMRNTEHLTAEQVTGKPIKREIDGEIIGTITGADENYIYGTITSSLNQDSQSSFSIITGGIDNECSVKNK